MTNAEFKARLLEDSIGDGDVESSFSFLIFMVEKEMGLNIQHDYPIMKAFNLFEELKDWKEKENKAMKKQNRRGFR